MEDAPKLSGDLESLVSWWQERQSGGIRKVAWIASDSIDHTPSELIDRAVDSGATLATLYWQVGDVAARCIVADITGSPASAVVERTATTDDLEWMRSVAAIRDSRSEAETDPIVQAVAEALIRASERKLPVLFDGITVHAAALVGAQQDTSHAFWWLPASSSADPAIQLAQRDLALLPALDLQTDGTGSAALQAATALLDLFDPAEESR